MFAGHMANIEAPGEAGWRSPDRSWTTAAIGAGCSCSPSRTSRRRALVATDPVIIKGEMVAEYHRWYGLGREHVDRRTARQGGEEGVLSRAAATRKQRARFAPLCVLRRCRCSALHGRRLRQALLHRFIDQAAYLAVGDPGLALDLRLPMVSISCRSPPSACWRLPSRGPRLPSSRSPCMR